MSNFLINNGKIKNDSFFSDAIYRKILSQSIVCIIKDFGFEIAQERAIYAINQMVANCNKKKIILFYI